MEKTTEAGIYRLKDGRLMVRTTAKDPVTGRMVARKVTLDHHQTMKEAIFERERIKQQIREVSDAPPQWRTVADYVEHWWARRAETLAPSTRDRDEIVLAHWVLPFLGHIQIACLNRGHVVQYVAELDRAKKPDGTGYSRESRRGYWRLAKQMLLDLKAEAGLPVNPVERVKPPRRGGGKQRQKEVLTEPEMVEFLAGFKRMRPDRYLEVRVMAVTGMRPSGLYGLCWDSVDYETPALWVRRSASVGELIETTKTGYERTVPIKRDLAELLREHRKTVLDSDLVFPASHGGPRRSQSIYKPLVQVSEVMGLELRVTPQVIRRSVNQMLLDRGVSQITIRAILGHHSPAMTEVYSHISMEAKASVVEGMPI
jgi:integrase/recombinase XerD